MVPKFLKVLQKVPADAARPGRAARPRTHGTTSLFAARDVKAGTVIGKCVRRHRTQEFRRFLDEVERDVPADLDAHVVMDNYCRPKTRRIRNRFAAAMLACPLHVDNGLIDQLAQPLLSAADRSRHQTQRIPMHREAAITAYIKATNPDPKPFRRTSAPMTSSPQSNGSAFALLRHTAKMRGNSESVH
jgi:hypothetical protein